MHRKCQLKMKSKSSWKHNMKTLFKTVKTKKYCQVLQLFRCNYIGDFFS